MAGLFYGLGGFGFVPFLHRRVATHRASVIIYFPRSPAERAYVGVDTLDAKIYWVLGTVVPYEVLEVFDPVFQFFRFSLDG